MKFVLGLGNPGFRYRNTRHNVGFLIVDRLSKKFHIPVKKTKCKGLLGRGSIEGEKTVLFMPQTYMNLSGDAVSELLKKECVGTEDFVVVCDDLDLKFGSIRLRERGSAGGHNGLKSIIKSLGKSDFQRLRIGIGQKEKPKDSSRFVLTPFTSMERRVLKAVKEEAVECIITWIKEGPSRAMSLFNS